MICIAVCQNNCSGHGQCDQATKRCVCSGFWMENFFLANFGERQSNCGELLRKMPWNIVNFLFEASDVCSFWSSLCWMPLQC